MKTYTIAIDIGNTNSDIGLIDADTLTCVFRQTIPSSDDFQPMFKAVETIAKNSGVHKDISVKICTVRKITIEDIAKTISNLSGILDVSTVKHHLKLPLKFNYENIHSLGNDRIANCLYAVRKYPGKNCIIIDVGTAINVELVKASNEFVGGFIFPGISAQLSSLHEKTSKLPSLTFNKENVKIPPDSTTSAMISGVCYSVAGGINFIVERCKKELMKDAKVLVTGGGWDCVKELVQFNCSYVKDLTLVGIGLFGGEEEIRTVMFDFD